MFKGYPISKTTYYRRLKKAKTLGCLMGELKDGRGKHSNHSKGQNNGHWNNRTTISSHGYLKIDVGKSHPLADPNGYAYVHLLVWCSSGNKRPSAGQVLHHTNGNKLDNRIENIEIKSSSEHTKHHHMLRLSAKTRLSSRKLEGQAISMGE